MAHRFQHPLELIALICGAITFGTAYYLLFLAHPSWSAAPFDAFLPVFQAAILKIGMSQVVISTTAMVACIVLFFMTKRRWWILAVFMLLVSLPVTMFWLMPINIAFIEATDPELATNAPDMLKSWGKFQVLRVIADGLAFLSICVPIVWRET